jgi:integrase
LPVFDEFSKRKTFFMTKEFLLLPLFEQFVRYNSKGRRLKPNGFPVTRTTAKNYVNTLRLLREFEVYSKVYLRIKLTYKMTPKQLHSEFQYWRRFYASFSGFIYKKGNCFDNYLGTIMKNIRAFFRYLIYEKHMMIGDFYRLLYVKREEVEILILQPSRLSFLICNKDFENSLPRHLQRTKDFFVFGSALALQFSDLQNIRKCDINNIEGNWFLFVRSKKTDSVSRIKLPRYAIVIFDHYSKRKSPSTYLFNTGCLRQFNKNLQAIAERAGWTEEIGKRRKRNGQVVERYRYSKGKQLFRFCDLISSHCMRRTGITAMLMTGMPEHVVRRISGHAPQSHAFYRYVSLTQDFVDKEVDKFHVSLER